MLGEYASFSGLESEDIPTFLIIWSAYFSVAILTKENLECLKMVFDIGWALKLAQYHVSEIVPFHPRESGYYT